jgi:hypothetical protein
MPNRPKNPSPAVQTRIGLKRAREEGLSFEEAWDRVVGRFKLRGSVKFPHATEYRREWREILESTKPEWRCAYERRPSRLSAALDQVHAVLEARPDIELGPDAVRVAVAQLPLPTSTPIQLPPGYEAQQFALRPKSKVAA